MLIQGEENTKCFLYLSYLFKYDFMRKYASGLDSRIEMLLVYFQSS